MDNVFLAEVRLFAGNYPPYGWAFCNGQLMAIRQYSALFSLIGINFGGDGQTTFALPNLQGNVPVGVGSGPGLTQRVLGEQYGSSNTTLLITNLPAHTHTMNAVSAAGSTPDPTSNIFAAKGKGDSGYTSSTPNCIMNPMTINVAGASQPLNTMQPYLALNFCIALQGAFPARN